VKAADVERGHLLADSALLDPANRGGDLIDRDEEQRRPGRDHQQHGSGDDSGGRNPRMPPRAHPIVDRRREDRQDERAQQAGDEGMDEHHHPNGRQEKEESRALL
jgi:hypothetical protein